MKHPDWATKPKLKGTELKLINGKYYLHEAKCVCDPENKKPKKITGKIPGRIMPEEFIESPKRKLEKKSLLGHVKEYGASKFILDYLIDSIESLQRYLMKNGN